MSDLARTVAFVFRRKGTAELADRDFVHVLSLDLRWMAPAEAKRALALAVERGLLLREGERVRPAFPPSAVEVPVGWRATAAVLEEAPAPPPAPPPAASPLLAEAARAAGITVEALQQAAAEERERAAGLLGEEAAAVLAVARRGVDVRGLAGKARSAT